MEVQFRAGKLFLDGKQCKKHIFPPTVTDMCNIESAMQKKMDQVGFKNSSIHREKNSSFVSYAAKISNSVEICTAYRKIKQLNPDADHIMVAFVLKDYTGHHDDGEHGASKRMLNILLEKNCSNMVVFTFRVYGGIPLGHKRYFYIDKATNEALNEMP